MKTNHQRGYVAGNDHTNDGARMVAAKLPSGAGMARAFVDEQHNGRVSQAGRVRGAKHRVTSLVRRDAVEHIKRELEAVEAVEAVMASNKHLKVGDTVVAPHKLCNVYHSNDEVDHECVADEGDLGEVASLDAMGEPCEFLFINKGVWYWDGFTTFPSVCQET